MCDLMFYCLVWHYTTDLGVSQGSPGNRGDATSVWGCCRQGWHGSCLSLH